MRIRPGQNVSARSLWHWFQKRNKASAESGAEQPPEWYDDAYTGSANSQYTVHYSASNYFDVWSALVAGISRHATVLEIGCGPGQLAQFIKDRCGCSYTGFDFSAAAVEMARHRNPSLAFHVANALDTELLNREDYDVVICTEVLEHINDDLHVLARVRPGVRCLLTVPNFAYVSHVRHFETARMVSARYEHFFSSHRVEEFRMKDSTSCFFLLDGTRNHRTIDAKAANEWRNRPMPQAQSCGY